MPQKSNFLLTKITPNSKYCEPQYHKSQYYDRVYPDWAKIKDRCKPMADLS